MDSKFLEHSVRTELRLREIPYNNTSFSDREIVGILLGEDAWEEMSALRDEVQSRRSVRMLYEVLGDIWAIERNPYLIDDMLSDRNRRQLLISALRHRIAEIRKRELPEEDGSESRESRLVQKTSQAVEDFVSRLQETARLREKAQRALRHCTSPANICFDGYARASEQTDASDWRIRPPFCVIRADSAGEIASAVKACSQLGLPIKVHSGGTGLAGSGIPLSWKTAVISTDRLSAISDVFRIDVPGGAPIQAIRCEAGATIEAVRSKARQQGCLLALDPGSSQACCVGGCIALNSAGRSAARWGSTADCLWSWKVIGPDGSLTTVERIGSRQKVTPASTLAYRITTEQGGERILELPGSALHPATLSMDASDKFLGGLPGLQKEGSDGILVEAVFALEPIAAFQQSFCLEFPCSATGAAQACRQISTALESGNNQSLSSLEILDHHHLESFGWTLKTNADFPVRSAALGNLCSSQFSDLQQARGLIEKAAGAWHAGCYWPADSHQAQACRDEWERFPAVCAATNAFQVHCDVVLPDAAMDSWLRDVERINAECRLESGLAFLASAEERILAKAQELGPEATEKCRSIIGKTRRRWNQLKSGLDLPGEPDVQGRQDSAGIQQEAPALAVSEALEAGVESADIRTEVLQPVLRNISGIPFEGLRMELTELEQESRANTVRAALHIHACGNRVHVTIPVNSDSYGMLKSASLISSALIGQALESGGSLTGHLGIGMTNLPYLSQSRLDAIQSYLVHKDPQGVFESLFRDSTARLAHTSSFSLLKREALLLEQNMVLDLSNAIRRCVRCGRCRTVCPMYAPLDNMRYSPHEKSKSLAPLIDALLYEVQTRRGISPRHYIALEEISDHCILCGQCAEICPVGMDFSSVSLKIREILANHRKLHTPLPERALQAYFRSRNFSAGQAGYRILKTLAAIGQRDGPQGKKPAGIGQLTTRTRPNRLEYGMFLLRHPRAQAMPQQNLRTLLGLEDSRYVSVIHPRTAGQEKHPVILFPGCLGEKIAPQIALAAMAVLWSCGIPVVLPPGALCCGMPSLASGRTRLAAQTFTENRILLHRMANTLNYLDVHTVLTVCSHCQRVLEGYRLSEIFPGCSLEDLFEFFSGHGIGARADGAVRYIWQCPQTPGLGNDEQRAASLLESDSSVFEEQIEPSACAGLLDAAHRPDIAAKLLSARKQRTLEAIEGIRSRGFGGQICILSTGPNSEQRLVRQNSVSFRNLAVEIARCLLGNSWQEDFIDSVRSGCIENVLL